jgi:hypothetical protein
MKRDPRCSHEALRSWLVRSGSEGQSCPIQAQGNAGPCIRQAELADGESSMKDNAKKQRQLR